MLAAWNVYAWSPGTSDTSPRHKTMFRPGISSCACRAGSRRGPASPTPRSLQAPLKVRRVHVPGDLWDLRHLATVINPDLGLDLGLELGAHGRDQVLVLFPIGSEVDRLLGVRLEVEKFRVVRLVEFVERRRAVALDGSEV